jgi:hypothetical protein
MRSRITWDLVNEISSVKMRSRAKRIEEVFSRYLDARLAFCNALERCATKGWPDRVAVIRESTRLQELFFARLSARLAHLVLQNDSEGVAWNEYTNNLKVHERIQDFWSESEERALRSRDEAYVQLESRIAELQSVADPQALEEPFRMAKRDPELISAGWDLDRTVRALDEELALL